MVITLNKIAKPQVIDEFPGVIEYINANCHDSSIILMQRLKSVHMLLTSEEEWVGKLNIPS